MKKNVEIIIKESHDCLIDSLSLDEVIAENAQRKLLLEDHYDPIAGVGSYVPRVAWRWHDDDGEECEVLIPEAMARELESLPSFNDAEWQQLRIKHDFEYWCATCVSILDKVTGRMVLMRLNRPQRRVLALLEEQRRGERPLRLIMLKARQWGGSTLVQMYMAWIQLVLKRNWNSLICGHLLQTSAAIKGMYTRALRNYPKHLSGDGERPKLKTFEGSRNVQQLSGSESLIITGTAQNQDAIRGYDVKMAHLTEVAFWPVSTLHNPEDVIRSISGTVPLEPLTLLVIESTANGVGNFFHKEWIRAMAGQSDKQPVFVPWTEIAIYRQPVSDVAKLVGELDNYEKRLWEDGCTLEMINWYHHKRREYPTQNLMAAEFPTTDTEAFMATSRNLFPAEWIKRMTTTTTVPLYKGDMVAKGTLSLEGVDFIENDSGLMKVWKKPATNAVARNRYMVVVDVGGSTERSDWSVIAVIDRRVGDDFIDKDRLPEVVAQWRGHTQHDVLVWKAAQIARYYHNALLVFESNTLECESMVGDTLLNKIKIAYHNVFHRMSEGGGYKPGFHTNPKTKSSAVYNLLAYVRDGAYIENDQDAVNEMANYELQPRGGYGARRGTHDDILMTRAIGLQIIEDMRVAEGRPRVSRKEMFMKDTQLEFDFHQ